MSGSVLESIRNFLRLFEEHTCAEDRSLERLSDLLDRLLIAYHESADVGPETDELPPTSNRREVRQLVESRFPDLGLYGWAAPEDSPGSQILVGDAADDLADIYAELRGVAWLSEHSSQTDAVWQFRFGFQKHWGRHLLNLRSFLHWKLHEA